MKKKKLKIFVTGATGFIGKNFIDLYADKYHLLTPNHDKLELLDTNAVDKFFKKNRPDIVLHLANRGGSQKEADHQNPLSTNLRVFFNLVKNQDKFKKMIYVGSGAEYAKQYPIVKAGETGFDKRIPSDDFGFYKYVAAKYTEQSKDMINLRVFGIFGKHEDWRFRFVSNTICKALYNIPIEIQNNCYFDYLYINDFVNILDYFISHRAKFNTYNTGSGEKVRLDTIALKIVQLTGAKVPVKILNKKLANEYTCNNKRLKTEIKNLQFTPFAKSLTELVLWYRNNLSEIDKKSLNLKRVDIWKRHTI